MTIPISLVPSGVYRNIPDGYAGAVSFAENIKAHRQRLGMNQIQFAAHLGKTQSAVSKWETGGGPPTARDLRDIAGMLGTTVDAIMSGEPMSTQRTIDPTPELPPREKRLLRLYRSLPEDLQHQALGVLASLARLGRRPRASAPTARSGDSPATTERKGHGRRQAAKG